MENRNSYTIVGMFFVFCMSALAIFLWWMTSGENSKVEYKNYYIQTAELPSGVKVDSQVKFIGVVAGSVSAIDFVHGDTTLIEITMKIRDDLPIKKDSLASIELNVISGVAVINISRGILDFDKNERPIIKLDANLLSKISSNAKNITEKIDQSLDKLNNFFSDKNIAKLQSILEHIDVFTANISDPKATENIDIMIQNLRDITNKLNQSDTKELISNLNTLLINSNKFIGSINKLAQDFDNMQNLLALKISGGEYDLRALLNPAVVEFSRFLNDFQKTLREFRGALYRLEESPYEFFFKDTQENGDRK
ncbi:MCE family protein [Campylobacter sp. faydin G-105]|uniref:MlaD family protein n=1 Tax=Campylobacter anatolicus TaxID=2829105 RepID=UPI001BA220C4|nr:MlaD family protein [Campylobacter anatolicus]MBR8462801.1 MCE family protein [Campylobacter anatolicus]